MSAKEKCHIEPVASPEVNGSARYNGLIITKAFNSLNELRGSKFGFVDEKSASGYLYAKAFLEDERLFSRLGEMKFLGSHDKVIEAVDSGDIDAGATYNEALENYRHKSNITTLHQTDDIPKDAIVLNGKTRFNFKERYEKCFNEL